MYAYLARRLSFGLLVILTVSVLAFSSLRLVPADVVDVMLGLHSTPEAEAALRHQLGLDQPAALQYFRWLAGVLRGDLGVGLRSRLPVASILRQRLPVTLELTILATLTALVIGVPSGVIAALRQYSMADHISTLVSVLGLAIPQFWLATLLILVFSLTWTLLPPGGVLPSVFEDPVGNLKRMVMPVLSLGLPSAALYFRMTRSAMLEVIGTDYMVTAYSKGLSERKAIMFHALKNALIPVATVAGLEITWMLGGSFVIESIFALPGLGLATVRAIYDRDFTVLQGCLLLYSMLVVVGTIAVDLVYLWLDPRISFEQGEFNQ